MAMLRVRDVSKSFGATRALSNVSLNAEQGEIHAILGENGAGKSTLMNILGGLTPPDSGELVLDDKLVKINSPREARNLGIEMVHQHFMLVPNFTVAENLALSQSANLQSTIDIDKVAEPLLEAAKALNWEFDPKARVGDLSVGVQQRLEITKCLVSTCKILILDEPTASLSEPEIIELFSVIRSLKEKGITVLIIAHKLQEIMAIADKATVLRLGVLIGTVEISKTSEAELGEMMLGKSETIIRKPNSINAEDQIVASWANQVVRRGEILGIGGVDGNGQVELAEMLAGITPASQNLKLPEHVAYIPQDRQLDGLALTMSVQDNLLVTSPLLNCSLLSPGKAGQSATELIEKFQIKVNSGADLAGSLSGGNQQKIVVARNLTQTPDLLVAVNPTRGLDFNAASFVHDQFRQAAANGTAVILISTDRDELAELADRTLYLSRGVLKQSMEEAIG